MTKFWACIHKGEWRNLVTGETVPGPDENEIVTFKALYHHSGGIAFSFKEYPESVGGVYNSVHFRPVDTTFGEVVTETILQQIAYEKALK